MTILLHKNANGGLECFPTRGRSAICRKEGSGWIPAPLRCGGPLAPGKGRSVSGWPEAEGPRGVGVGMMRTEHKCVVCRLSFTSEPLVAGAAAGPQAHGAKKNPGSELPSRKSIGKLA